MGNSQTQLINNQIDSSDLFLLTSSFSINTPSAVLMQNFPGTWTEFRLQVRLLLGGTLAGINFIGSSVCGDTDIVTGKNVNEELCIRWYQFSSLTPLFRVRTDRTPERFSTHGKRIMIQSIYRRYSLISYFRSIMLNGKPLNTPMFYQYPELSVNATVLSDQFFVGESLLAAPVLMPSTTQKRIYMPGEYFEIIGGQQMPKTWFDFPVVETDVPLFIRAGHIVPLHSTTEVCVYIQFNPQIYVSFKTCFSFYTEFFFIRGNSFKSFNIKYRVKLFKHN